MANFFRDNEVLISNKQLGKPSIHDPVIISRLFKRFTNKTLKNIQPDQRRVITRPFRPSSDKHAINIVNRVLAMDENKVKALLTQTLKDFAHRHKDIQATLMCNFERVIGYIKEPELLTVERKLLLGSCFTMEYSIESTALFNPSIVIYPKQNNIKKGQTRVILSFRATGEGHISSIVFRSALIDRDNTIFLESVSPFLGTPEIVVNTPYDQESNYEILFPHGALISERVIFPLSQSESNGVEDARFVRFLNDDGSIIYYATYTAYNGREISSQLIETLDFHRFKISALDGPMAKNKGMALFPRKINGQYAMITRSDGENLYLSYSNDIHSWNEGVKIESPENSWELVQIGNCGAPLETTKGWIMLTHGVGPMRKYCIGVVLLDLKDPSKIISRLEDPLLMPREEEREGYVPNVVYSCGSIILNGELIIPYAISDYESHVASIPVDELLEKLLKKN